MSKSLSATALFSALALAACQTTNGGCPPLVVYSAAAEARASVEFHALPKGSELRALIRDYGKTRDACRVSLAR